MNSNGGIFDNINKYFKTMIPFETQKKLGDFSGFLSSNTMIESNLPIRSIDIFLNIILCWK